MAITGLVSQEMDMGVAAQLLARISLAVEVVQVILSAEQTVAIRGEQVVLLHMVAVVVAAD